MARRYPSGELGNLSRIARTRAARTRAERRRPMSRYRRHLTFANVVSLVALFVALGGGAYAVHQAKKNSVTSKSIRDGAVRSQDVKDAALTGADVLDGSLSGADINQST